MSKISVIVPVYNTEKYLSKCLDSIINQTYKNLEIILIDDGSKDNSGKICDEYANKDSRIKVIHKENGGVSSARNEGLKIASGEYIAFVDSDDWLEADMYDSMLKKLIENDVDLVRCSYYKEFSSEIYNSKHVYNRNLKLDLKSERLNIIELLITGNLHAYLPLLLLKKRYINLIQYFNTDVAMREDLIWMIELVCVIDAMYIYSKPLYHYYQNPNSASNAVNFKNRNMKNMLVVNCEIEKIFKKYNVFNQDLTEILAFSFFLRVSSELTTLLYSTRKIEILKDMVDNEYFKRHD